MPQTRARIVHRGARYTNRVGAAAATKSCGTWRRRVTGVPDGAGVPARDGVGLVTGAPTTLPACAPDPRCSATARLTAIAATTTAHAAISTARRREPVIAVMTCPG